MKKLVRGLTQAWSTCPAASCCVLWHYLAVLALDARAIGYRNWTAALLGAFGLHALTHGDHGLARARWDESLRLFEGSMDWPEVSAVENYLAGLDALEDNLAAAAAGYAASIALAHPARFVFRVTESLDGLAIIAAKQGQMQRALVSARRAVGAAAAAAARAAGQAMSFDQAVDEALAQPTNT